MKRCSDGDSAWTITLLFTSVIAATYAFGVYLFPALLPDMRAGLGLSYAEIGQIAATRQVAFLLTALAAAVAVQRFGAGWVILGSVSLCGLALCGLAMAQTGWMAAGLLILLNACAASAWIPMVSLVARVVAYRHQGKSVGLIASGTNYGLCLNGVAVPPLLAAFGWRSVWLAAGGLTLLLCVAVWWCLARASLLTAAVEDRAESAMGWREIVQRRYLVVFGLALLGGCAGVPFANYLSAYLRDDLGLSVGVSGACWLATGLAGAVGGTVFGAIGDKAGLRTALLMAAALLAGSAVVAVMGRTAVPLVLAAGCFGASFFSIFGLLPAYVAKTSAPGLTPALCGLVECALGVGGALGSFAGGLSPHMLGSFRPVYLGAALCAGLMIGLAACLPAERRA